MRIEWHTVGDLCGRVYKELEATATSRFDGLVNIGIDETIVNTGSKGESFRGRRLETVSLRTTASSPLAQETMKKQA